MVFRFILLFFLSGAFLPALSQWWENNPRITHFDEDDGLSNAHVIALVEDYRGYLWVGTQNGLNRFNGEEFETFYPNEDGRSIPDGKINHLIESSDQRLWIASEGGLCEFIQETETFVTYVDSIPGVGIRSRCEFVMEDNEGFLWVGYENLVPSLGGISRFDPRTGKFKHFLTKEHNGIQWIHQDESNPKVFWVAVFDGMMKFEADSGVHTFFQCPEGRSRRFLHQNIQQCSPNEIIVPMIPEGVFKIDTETLEWTKLSDQNQVYHVAPAGNGEWWIVDRNVPLIRMDANGTELRRFKHGEAGDYQIEDTYSTFLYEDSQSRIWLAHKEGLSLIDPWIQNFNYAELKVEETDKLRLTHGFKSEKYDVLIVGSGTSFQGMLFLDPISLEIKRQIKKYPNGPFKGDGFKSYQMRYRDENSIFILTSDGLFIYYFEDDRFEMIVQDRDGSLKGLIYTHMSAYQAPYIVLQGKGNVIIIVNVEERSYEVKELVQDGRVETRSFDKPEFDEEGRLWIASKFLTGYLSPDFQEWKPISTYFQDPGLAERRFFRSISLFDDSLVFLGSQIQGLHQLNLNSGEVEVIRPQNSRGQYWSIYCAKGQNDEVWALADKGMLRWNPLQKEGQWFNKRNGLPFSNWYGGSINLNEDGSFVSVKDNSVLVWHPDSIVSNPSNPGIEFTSIEVNGKPISHHSAAFIDSLQLEANQTDLTFAFSGIDLSGAENLNYAYKLEGIDEDWNDAGERRYATYANLKGGDYTLRIKSTKNEDSSKTCERSIALHIATPFYQQLWFLALCVISFILLVVGLLNLKYRRERAKRELEESFARKLAEVELSALRAQMNPHFLFNSLNSIKNFIVKNKQEEAADYLTKFSRLIRLILNNSTTELIPLSEELQALKLYLQMESLRFDNGFFYELNIDPKIDQETVKIAPMLIQPFVENSIWHGLLHKDEPGSVWVTILKREDYLVCEIKDNGIGRKKSAEIKKSSKLKRNSLGAKITSSRIEVINSLYEGKATMEITDLYDDDGAASGTKVQLQIPY